MHTPHMVKRFLYGLIVVHIAFSQTVAGDSADTEVGEELLQLLYEALKPQEISCPDDATCRCIRFDPERALEFGGYMYAQWCPIDAGNDLAKGHWKVTNSDQDWKKVSDGEYLDKKMHGTWTYWRADGRKEVQEEFDQGRRIGTSYRWHENGVIAITGNHVDGEQHGVWIFRDEGGRITRRVHWDKGKVVAPPSGFAEAGTVAVGEIESGNKEKLLLPDEFMAEVKREFPMFRLPKESDGQRESHYENETFSFVCRGDFDGSGTTDIAAILVNDSDWRIAVFHRAKNGSFNLEHVETQDTLRILPGDINPLGLSLATIERDQVFAFEGGEPEMSPHEFDAVKVYLYRKGKFQPDRATVILYWQSTVKRYRKFQ